MRYTFYDGTVLHKTKLNLTKSDSVESTPKLGQKMHSMSTLKTNSISRATSQESLIIPENTFDLTSEFEQIEEEGLTTSLGFISTLFRNNVFL